MAEEFDKSEQATQFKLDEARKKGQIAKSMELPSFFSLVAMTATISLTLSAAGMMLFTITSWWLENADYLAVENSQLVLHFTGYLSAIARFVLPVVLAGLAASVVASLIHSGAVFSFYPLKPEASKLNPVTGIKKIFSRKSLVELIKLVVKIGLFAGVAYMVWRHEYPYLMRSNYASTGYLLRNWQSAFYTLSYSLLGVFLLSAIFDLWFSKLEFARQMRMSKRDVKDEHKRHEGDPEIKAKRKKALRELLTKAGSIKNVKDSDVIITNPSHVAVALQYRPEIMVLPIVLAKGQGLLAAEIRRQARKNRIPIIRKPELARALLKSVTVGNPIPQDEQTKVASIYRWVLAMPENRVFSP